MDATARINELIKIAGELTDVLTRENEMLLSRELNDLADMVKEKLLVCRSYEAHVHELVSNPLVLTEVEMDLHEQLRDLGAEADTLMDANARLLKAAIMGNKQLLKLVSDAVKDVKAGIGTYTPSGKVGENAAHSAHNNASVSIDQSL